MEGALVREASDPMSRLSIIRRGRRVGNLTISLFRLDLAQQVIWAPKRVSSFGGQVANAKASCRQSAWERRVSRSRASQRMRPTSFLIDHERLRGCTTQTYISCREHHRCGAWRLRDRSIQSRVRSHRGSLRTPSSATRHCILWYSTQPLGALTRTKSWVAKGPRAHASTVRTVEPSFPSHMSSGGTHVEACWW